MRNPDALGLVLMGTGPFAVPAFEALRGAGHDIRLVVTRPERGKRGRKGPPPSPVRQWAEKAGLPIEAPSSANTSEAIKRLSSLSPQLLVVCDYGEILVPEMLGVAPLGGVNLHGSLLPAYRGAAPVQWALWRGEKRTGVSVIHMTPRLDGGPVLASRSTSIGDQETAGDLEARLAVLGVDATQEALSVLANWDGQSVIGSLQDASKVSKAPRLTKKNGCIQWSQKGVEIDRHVRAMQPWPGAFTVIPPCQGRAETRLAIQKVVPIDSGYNELPDDVPYGTVVIDSNLCVVCKDGLVRIERLQPAGRREMSASEFLRGRPFLPDTRLGPGSPL